LDRDDQEVTVSTDTGARGELLERIRARRVSINAYVRNLEPRGARLTNLSIICSAVVTALTAGPALGGVQFTESSARVFNITDDSLVWRLLCFAAMVLSLVAAIATNLYKSHDIAARLAKAESCSAALEGLETLVEFGRLPLAEAVKQYQQAVAEVPFIHEEPPASR
jgi:MFS family permease